MILEILSAFIILAIAMLFLTVSSLTMPSTLFSMLVVLLLLAFIVFTTFVLKEKPADEREAQLSQQAGRASFLAGVGILVIGIIYQAFMHNIDIWLVGALCLMVTTKLIFLILTNHKN